MRFFPWRNNFIKLSCTNSNFSIRIALYFDTPSISEGCDQLGAEQREKKYCAIRSIFQAETDNRASADYKIYYFQSTAANWENKILRLSTRENYFRFFVVLLFIYSKIYNWFTLHWWCHTSRHSSFIITLRIYL